MHKILIVGAGIAGLALARHLKKLNIPFDIIEKRPALFAIGSGLALPPNALQALRYLGLGDQIDHYGHQVNKVIYATIDGETLNAASLLEPPLNIDHFVALHRHKFHDILSAGLIDSIQFSTTVESITETDDHVLVKFNNSSKNKYSLVVGADGINSIVRQLTFPEVTPVDLGVAIWRWIVNYPTENLQPTYQLGGKDIFMAYPMGENEVYCYAHAYDPEQNHPKSSDQKNLLAALFKHYAGTAKSFFSNLPENIITGRLRSISPPIFSRNRVVLIGDAAHACSPMLQQGASLALEDAITLAELLNNFSVKDALANYEKLRNERINWVTQASDGPMKTLITADENMLAKTQQKIREQGPLNVFGWRQLLANNPLKELTTLGKL